MKLVKAILTRKEPVAFDGKKWEYKDYSFEVYIMAVVDGFAMVRRKGCMPFVCQAKELVEVKSA